MHSRPLPLLLTLAVFAPVAAGCEDEARIVEVRIESLAATDSVAVGQALDVQFGYYAIGEDRISSHRWEEIAPATFRLRAFARVGPDEERIGAPVAPTSSTVRLETPPRGRFSIVAGEVELSVVGGSEPRASGVLRVRLTQDGAPVEGVALRLWPSTTAGPGSAIDLPVSDASGVTTVEEACPTPGGRFRIEPADDAHAAYATFRWPDTCSRPLTLAVPAFDASREAHPLSGADRARTSRASVRG